MTGGRQGRYVGGRKRLLWGGKRVLVKCVQIFRLSLPWGRDRNMALDLQGVRLGEHARKDFSMVLH